MSRKMNSQLQSTRILMPNIRPRLTPLRIAFLQFCKCFKDLGFLPCIGTSSPASTRRSPRQGDGASYISIGLTECEIKYLHARIEKLDFELMISNRPWLPD